MKFLHWKIQLGLALIGASAALYGLNYLIFRDTNYMLRLFLAQLGFLPISVLLVTIILNQLLGLRAKAAKLAKLNMVIGAFFSEVGGPLLKTLTACDRHLPDFQRGWPISATGPGRILPVSARAWRKAILVSNSKKVI